MFSPDGQTLAYASCRGDCEIYQVDPRTGSETQITNLAVQAKFPEWCRDPGKPWIVFEGRPNRATHQVWMVDVETGRAEQLSYEGSDSRPAWSSDCSQVVFGRALKDTDRNGALTGNDFLDIYILDVETKETWPLINTVDMDEFNYSWSPDGEWIAFTRVQSDSNGDGHINLNDQSDLYIIHPDGSGERNLTRGFLSVFSPTWSPDGQAIIFTHFRSSENQEIWIYSLETGEFSQVTGSGPYYHPHWSP